MSIKWVPRISGNWMVKSKLPPQSSCSLKTVESHPWKRDIKFVFTHIFFNLLDNGSWNNTLFSIQRILGSNQLFCVQQMPTYCLFSSSIVLCKHAIYVHVGTEKNRQLINISELSEEIGKVWSTLFFCFYVFMDKIYTSAFKGKKKVTPLKKLMMSPGFHNSFRYLFIVYLFQI